MGRRKDTTESEDHKSPPFLTAEAQENTCITLARELAEKQLREGTAAPSVINHYLKMGSPKSKLELELLKEEIVLTRAKAKATETEEETLKIYKDAIKAMGIYAGDSDSLEDEEFV